jgi:hypothetical protein
VLTGEKNMSTLPAFKEARLCVGQYGCNWRHHRGPKGEQDRLYDEDEIRSTDLKKQQDVAKTPLSV